MEDLYFQTGSNLTTLFSIRSRKLGAKVVSFEPKQRESLASALPASAHLEELVPWCERRDGRRCRPVDPIELAAKHPKTYLDAFKWFKKSSENDEG